MRPLVLPGLYQGKDGRSLILRAMPVTGLEFRAAKSGSVPLFGFGQAVARAIAFQKIFPGSEEFRMDAGGAPTFHVFRTIVQEQCLDRLDAQAADRIVVNLGLGLDYPQLVGERYLVKVIEKSLFGAQSFAESTRQVRKDTGLETRSPQVLRPIQHAPVEDGPEIGLAPYHFVYQRIVEIAPDIFGEFLPVFAGIGPAIILAAFSPEGVQEFIDGDSAERGGLADLLLSGRAADHVAIVKNNRAQLHPRSPCTPVICMHFQVNMAALLTSPCAGAWPQSAPRDAGNASRSRPVGSSALARRSRDDGSISRSPRRSCCSVPRSSGGAARPPDPATYRWAR